jgi:hypothetical protein
VKLKRHAFLQITIAFKQIFFNKKLHRKDLVHTTFNSIK